jgi:DNA repair photolyase
MITVAAPRAPLVEEIPACRMLSVNTYLACDIRCVYCITGAQGRSRPRFGAETVREELQQELATKGHRQPLVGLGTLCDAYPSVEVELGVTRIVLDELTQLGWPVRVVTKGVGVRRDVDLLLRGDGHVTVSLSTLDGNAAARLEPGAPTPAERLDLVHELADAGVPVWVSVTPWVPGVTDITSVARSVGSTIPIRVAPLNVNSPEVKRTGFGRRFDQREIDCAYIEERERSTELTSVRWLPPVTARGPDHQEQVMIPLEAPTGCATQTRGQTRDVTGATGPP